MSDGRYHGGRLARNSQWTQNKLEKKAKKNNNRDTSRRSNQKWLLSEQAGRGHEISLATVSVCFYLSTTSLLFMRQGWFLNVAINFFFSSTCSFRASISPSDNDSPSDSEEEEEELIKGEMNHVPTSDTNKYTKITKFKTSVCLHSTESWTISQNRRRTSRWI